MMRGRGNDLTRVSSNFSRGSNTIYSLGTWKGDNKMTLDKLIKPTMIQDRIDKAVNDTRMFFDLSLPTVLKQVRQDMRYIKTICRIQDVNPRGYLNYYKEAVRGIKMEYLGRGFVLGED